MKNLYVNGCSFTAGHDTACLDEAELMPGLIIESTGEVWCKPTSSFEIALPFTQLTNSNGSKKVFGVIPIKGFNGENVET